MRGWVNQVISSLQLRLFDKEPRKTYASLAPGTKPLHSETMEPSGKRKRNSAIGKGSSDTDPDQQDLCAPVKRTAALHPPPPAACTVHRVLCSQSSNHESHSGITYFEDTPRLFAGDSKASALRGKSRIHSITEFLESRPHVSFILYRVYYCNGYHTDIEPQFRALERPKDPFVKSLLPYFYQLDRDGAPAESYTEAMDLLSEELRLALHQLTGLGLDTLSDLNQENLRALVARLYHHRRDGENHKAPENVVELHWKVLIPLLDFMESIFGGEYDEADALFSQGLVTKYHMAKLFGSKDILTATEKGQPCAYMLDHLSGHPPELSCWTWRFDGQFWKHHTTFAVELPEVDERIAIADLPMYPLRYADPKIQELLKSRGEQFWSLRHGRYVSYTPAGMEKNSIASKSRYMVDMLTYRTLHSKVDTIKGREYLSDEEMNAEEPPDEMFLHLLPATVQGFAFQEKKWHMLHVSQISVATWNKQAFDHLVLQSTKKELIQALVKKHNSDKESMDVIEGKGNGLILLLHGGPGTGKTLTAETVAELTQRPLYRVTCGDVGTNADDVEQYLESVLHLGKIWRCVVLLDEADVFLEERTQHDLKRNALVSVFLRVIEYYDGILVLTSNRVGTFDEAFKSRVHLIVHYPNLQRAERRRIWSNFITGLQNSRVKVHVTELQEHLDDLSDYELNGRNIRNTIQTAALLAQFRKKRLCYEHLKEVITISEEFKGYLRETYGHDTDEFVRVRQLRAE
ncbi:ATPaseAAA-typecore [Penicillium lividum]|nr:ATPaseAAA-typecore [Penicillium lividum]